MPVGPNDISVRIYRRLIEDRPRFHKDTAGFAVAFPKYRGSGLIHVFFDRLGNIVQDSRGDCPLELLIGITVAHEMGSLLLPNGHHSRWGIMSARVREEYLRLAAQRWLGFTVEQQAIRKNVWQWKNQSDSRQLAFISTPEVSSSR
jgi:hypothetical protein